MTDVVDRPARKGLRPAAPPVANPPGESPAPAVDVEALGRQLLGKWAGVRLQARDLAARPELNKIVPPYLSETQAVAVCRTLRQVLHDRTLAP